MPRRPSSPTSCAPTCASSLRPPRPAAGGFYVRNGSYESGDAESLYAIVRHVRPARVLELGSGASSHVIAAAARPGASEGHTFAHVTVDPYPFIASPLGPVPGAETRALPPRRGRVATPTATSLATPSSSTAPRPPRSTPSSSDGCRADSGSPSSPPARRSSSSTSPPTLAGSAARRRPRDAQVHRRPRDRDAIGPPGVGRTILATALGHKAVKAS